MPKIFSPDDKAAIRRRLLELGLEELERGGFRKCAVESLASKAGIAKGTFYNFFPSKEAFFYEVMLSIRDANRDMMRRALRSPGANRGTVADFLVERYTRIRTVFDYFSMDEMNIVFRKLPGKRAESESQSEAFLAELLAGMSDINPDLDGHIVLSMLNVMAMASSNAELIVSGSKEATIRFLAESLAEYLFRKETRHGHS